MHCGSCLLLALLVRIPVVISSSATSASSTRETIVSLKISRITAVRQRSGWNLLIIASGALLLSIVFFVVPSAIKCCCDVKYELRFVK